MFVFIWILPCIKPERIAPNNYVLLSIFFLFNLFSLFLLYDYISRTCDEVRKYLRSTFSQKMSFIVILSDSHFVLINFDVICDNYLIILPNFSLAFKGFLNSFTRFYRQFTHSCSASYKDVFPYGLLISLIFNQTFSLS